jgi:hypothetical protein
MYIADVDHSRGCYLGACRHCRNEAIHCHLNINACNLDAYTVCTCLYRPCVHVDLFYLLLQATIIRSFIIILCLIL